MDTITIVIACIVASVVLIISVVILRKLRQSSAKSTPSWSSQKAPGYNIGSEASDAEALRKKFEHCGGSELLSPRSDGIRLDEIIRQEETPDTPSPQLLRLDAAVPNKVQLNKVFDLAVTVRQTSSPVLSEDDLPVVKSGDVQVSWPKSQSYVRLRIQVSAPDCEIHGEDNRLFRLFWGQDSPMFYFHLTPKKQGVISIIVRVYQEHDWLGSARVHTIAYEQIVGSVQVEITSQKMESTTPSLTTLSIIPSLIDLIESSGDFDSIEPQIMYLSRRLQKLREIQAVKGIDTEPHHLIEIEDLEAKLNELSKQRRDSIKGFHMDLSQ